MMTRREALRRSLAVSVLGMTGGAAIGRSLAADAMVLKAADVHPLGYPTVEAVISMGKKLEQATSGRLTVQMFAAMQLGGEKETTSRPWVRSSWPASASARSGPLFPISTSSTCRSCSATPIIWRR